MPVSCDCVSPVSGSEGGGMEMLRSSYPSEAASVVVSTPSSDP